MKKYLLLILVIFSLFVSSCSNRQTIEKLTDTQKAVFNLLPEQPQFLMYMNFKSMRNTEFWKQNVSDSILTAENNLGSILNVFKNATGASITDGLDEMYFANTWIGENAIILKGSFDKNKMNSLLSNDTIFRKISDKDSKIVYSHLKSNMIFFLKDNFTLCASNYQSQIDFMMNNSDSSNSGLIKNTELMKSIESVMYKENAFIVTNEKSFIKGIFANFFDMKSGKNISKEQLSSDSLLNSQPDSLSKSDDILLNKIYEKVNSVSLNLKMKNELMLNLQFECIDEPAAMNVRKLFDGLIGIAKITSAAKDKNQKVTAFEKILNYLMVENNNTSVFLSAKINNENINEFRAGNLFLQQK